MLHALTALAWGIPLACLWGQTRTVLGERNDLSGPFSTLAPDGITPPPPTPELPPTPPPSDSWECLPAIRSTVAEEVDRIAEAVTQTRRILRDAVAELHQSFHGLDSQTQVQHQLVVSLLGDMTGPTNTTQSSHLAKGRVDAMMVDIKKVNEHVAQSLQEIATVIHQMHTDVEVAARALQFEDIISQLLHYTEKSLGTLRCLGAALAEAAETNDSSQLLVLSTALAQRREEEQTTVLKPVAQTSMHAGDVELF